MPSSSAPDQNRPVLMRRQHPMPPTRRNELYVGQQPAPELRSGLRTGSRYAPPSTRLSRGKTRVNQRSAAMRRVCTYRQEVRRHPDKPGHVQSANRISPCPPAHHGSAFAHEAPARKVLTSVVQLCNNVGRNGEKRKKAFQQERYGSTKAPEGAASVVRAGGVSATLEDLGYFYVGL